MSSRLLAQIQNLIILGDYGFTQHAIDEMAKDFLTIDDIEHAVLNGVIAKIETGDRRGSRYTIVGLDSRAADGGRRGRAICPTSQLPDYHSLRGHRTP